MREGEPGPWLQRLRTDPPPFFSHPVPYASSSLLALSGCSGPSRVPHGPFSLTPSGSRSFLRPSAQAPGAKGLQASVEGVGWGLGPCSLFWGVWGAPGPQLATLAASL